MVESQRQQVQVGNSDLHLHSECLQLFFFFVCLLILFYFVFAGSQGISKELLKNILDLYSASSFSGTCQKTSRGWHHHSWKRLPNSWTPLMETNSSSMWKLTFQLCSKMPTKLHHPHKVSETRPWCSQTRHLPLQEHTFYEQWNSTCTTNKHDFALRMQS